MDPLKIGIVGAGGIAQRNATDSAKSGFATITGVFDTNHQAGRTMAKSLSAPVFATYDELLNEPSIEAVLLSVPHHLHKPMTVEAANHGKHVLVEKPMANNIAEAEEMIAACNKNNVKLTVNYSFRYLAKIRKAKEIITEGALGDITGVQIISHQFKDRGYWQGARSNSPDDWRSSKEKCGGGFLIMNVCHIIDYIYYLTDLKASRIYSEYATLDTPAEVEDIISVSFKLENGAIGSISASSIMRGSEQSEERIWGTKGTLIITPEDLSFYSNRPISKTKPGKLYKIKKFPNVSWTAEWVKNFALAVRQNNRPEISFREGWENLAFIQKAYESLENGTPLIVPSYPHV